MAAVPDQVLQWLYGVLSNEYHNAQAAYRDSVAALSAYPTLSARTDVYTYNNGQPALLLKLSGTLPVNFRGTVYRFPVTLWLPHAYPADREGIMVFVIAGDSMVVRPGQHVGVDGRVYHPYLRDWAMNQRPNIVDFLRILQDVFAREPPVVARPQQQSPMQRPPPPPKEHQRPQQQAVDMAAGNPPPRPPKPGDQGRATPPAHNRNHGPPLPPLPHERHEHSPRALQQGQQGQQGYGYESPVDRRYSRAPPLPQQPQQDYPHQPHQNYPQQPLQDYRQSPVPPQASNAQAGTPTPRYVQPPPRPPPQQHQQHHMPIRPAQPQFAQQYQQAPPQHYQQQQHANIAPPKPAPAQDLLSDPFDINLSTTTSAGPAPPIPPNPEKEHLLRLLSQSLVSQVHQKVKQNTSALDPLRAQSMALQDAHSRLNAELSQLTALDKTLASNERILHQALADCDRVINDSKSMPQPPIDDVLVAPTVAATQLWNLQADEAAIREALWCLQRAVGAGRVSSDTFVKMTRSLAREVFLKMALSRKLAKGLGLDVGSGRGAAFSGEQGHAY